MDFTFSHVFKTPVGLSIKTPLFNFNNISWYIMLRPEENSVAVYFFGKPDSFFVRETVPWTITSDIEYRVGDNEYYCNGANFRRSGKSSYYGHRLLDLKQNDLPEEHVKMNGGVFVSIRISNVRKEGLRKFEKQAFMENKGANSVVLISTLNNKKIYCDRQILEWSSPYFRDIIRGKETSEISFPSIVLDSNINVEDFLELLHHIHYPSETIDDYNLELLLRLGTKFEVSQVVERCRETMELKVFTSNASSAWRSKHIALTWKYKLESLKAFIIKTSPNYLAKDIISNHYYQETATDSRLELLENAVKAKTYKQSMKTKTSS